MFLTFLMSARYPSLLFITSSAHASCFAVGLSLVPDADTFASQVCSFLSSPRTSFVMTSLAFGCTRLTISTSLISLFSVLYLASWYASNLSNACLNHFLTAFGNENFPFDLMTPRISCMSSTLWTILL